MTRQPTRLERAGQYRPGRFQMADINDQPSRSDLRMIGQSVRGGWEIPDEIKQKLAGTVVRLLSEATTTRDKERMIKLLLEMNKQNMAAESPSPVTKVNVGVNVETEDRRNQALAVADRVRSRRLVE